jgi:hypothetical protein
MGPETTQNLFDGHGRLIPPPNVRVYSQESRRYFTLNQPVVNYSAIHAGIQKHLGAGNSISLADFEKRSKSALEKLQQNEKTKGLLSAVHVPFFCPPQTSDADIGQELEDIYLKAVGSAFTERFPEYSFKNSCEEKLSGRVSVVAGSRYEKLIQARKKGVVTGWYFPNCLSEYAIPDQQSLVSSLPDSLILSGGFDAAAAIAGSPDLLMKKEGQYPHLLALSALRSKDEKFFYHFEAYGWNLTFNRRSYVGAVSEYWAGGLTVLG